MTTHVRISADPGREIEVIQIVDGAETNLGTVSKAGTSVYLHARNSVLLREKALTPDEGSSPAADGQPGQPQAGSGTGMDTGAGTVRHGAPRAILDGGQP